MIDMELYVYECFLLHRWFHPTGPIVLSATTVDHADEALLDRTLALQS